MKPRPFYRWKSFWLGLFVLVFLGWAWGHSARFNGELVISAGPGRNALGLVQEEGVLRIWFGRDGAIRFRPFGGYLSPRKGEGQWLRSSVEFDEWKPGCRTLSVSYCILFSGTLLGWMGFLLWFWKREQKKLTA
jgi:hypothetical protein